MITRIKLKYLRNSCQKLWKQRLQILKDHQKERIVDIFFEIPDKTTRNDSYINY